MIYLKLEKCNFKTHEKWPLLYLIADVFNENAKFDKSLTDIEIVSILWNKYNLQVERRTISQYRRLLCQYFGFKFVKNGYGHKLLNHFNDNIKQREFSDDRIKYFNDIDYLREKKNIKFCLKAIRDDNCIKYSCLYFLKNDFSLKTKTLIMAPIQVFCYRDIYFLLSYCVTLRTHFILRLDKSDIVTKSFSTLKTSEILKNVEKMDLDSYLRLNPNSIVTGRIDWKRCFDLHMDHQIENYGESTTDFSFYNNDMPEIITTLYEKYGERMVTFKNENGHVEISLFIDSEDYVQ